jgi:hypothetical protein
LFAGKYKKMNKDLIEVTENFNSLKTQQSNFFENQIKRNLLYDIKINFKKKEIGEKKKIENLVQLLKEKINKIVKNEITNIGCGGFISWIFDNSFYFIIFI